MGKSLVYIRDNTAFKSVPDVVFALKDYSREVRFANDTNDEYNKQQEIDRLDTVQAEMWEVMTKEKFLINQNGDEVGIDSKDSIAAAKIVLQCIKQRSELEGLLKTDISQANAAVLVIGGKEADYIKQLQEAIPTRTD